MGEEGRGGGNDGRGRGRGPSPSFPHPFPLIPPSFPPISIIFTFSTHFHPLSHPLLSFSLPLPPSPPPLPLFLIIPFFSFTLFHHSLPLPHPFPSSPHTQYSTCYEIKKAMGKIMGCGYGYPGSWVPWSQPLPIPISTHTHNP